MERRTTERLVNLTIALLTTTRFVPKEKLHRIIEDYRDLSDDNFDRQFERDKATLRQLGVPIETGAMDPFFDDEQGYRIWPAEFELPPVDLTPAEVAVLVTAAQVWQQASTADSTIRALTKLWASGIEPDTDRLAALRPHISAKEPTWQPLWDALQARRRVTFTYHHVVRKVSPYVLAYRHGSWYVGGFDDARGAARLFKLGRIEGNVAPVGAANAFEVPDAPAHDLLAGLEDVQPDTTAWLEVRTDRAPWLTRRAEPVDGGSGEWRQWRLPYASGGAVVDEIAMGGADVRVLEPTELAAAVASHHQALIDHLGGES